MPVENGKPLYILCMVTGHFLISEQQCLLEAIGRLAYANPFLPERVECERAVLGNEFVEGEPVWSYRAEHPEPRENVVRIAAKVEPLVEQLRGRLRQGVRANERELALYEDAVLHVLYHRNYPHFLEAGFGSAQTDAGRWRFYNAFVADWRHFFGIDGVVFPGGHEPRHTFACYR